MPIHKKGLIVSISGQAPILIWSMRLKSQVVFIFGGLSSWPTKWLFTTQVRSRTGTDVLAESLEDGGAACPGEAGPAQGHPYGIASSVRLQPQKAPLTPCDWLCLTRPLDHCLTSFFDTIQYSALSDCQKHQTVALSMLTARSLPSGKLTI